MRIVTILTLLLMASAPAAHAAGLEGVARSHPASATIGAAVYVNGPAVVYMGGAPAETSVPAVFGRGRSYGGETYGSESYGGRSYGSDTYGSVAHVDALDQIPPLPPSRGFARSGDPGRRGLLRTAYHSGVDSNDAMSQAFDPIVDPVLETSMTAIGTTAGTAVGVALYAPLKVLEHLY